jgi:RNA polymerase sigma factor (sigma-70 family)
MNLDNLFNRAKSGDESAEKELFSILLVRFRIIASHIIGDRDAAHDAANDAAVSVLQTYRKLEVHTSFIAWAQTIIRRQALKYIEKRTKERGLIQEIGHRVGSNPHYEISPLIESKIMECLRKLSAINKGYVRILNLKHLGYTFDEICAKLNIDHNNAYVLLHRARKALTSCLKEEEK